MVHNQPVCLKNNGYIEPWTWPAWFFRAIILFVTVFEKWQINSVAFDVFTVFLTKVQNSYFKQLTIILKPRQEDFWQWYFYLLCPFLSSQRFTVLSIFCNKIPIFLIFRFLVRTWFCLSQLLNASLMNCVYNKIVLFISDGSWFAFFNSKFNQAIFLP